MHSNRRNFLSKLSLAAFSITGFSSFKTKQTEPPLKNIFIHHVYFWLKNPNSEVDANTHTDLFEELERNPLASQPLTAAA